MLGLGHIGLKVQGFLPVCSNDRCLIDQKQESSRIYPPEPPRHRQRMMMRPWKCDPVIASIMHQFVEKKNSPAKLITHFPSFQRTYEELRARSKEEVSLSKHVHSFAYAPQRYSSESQTLCRIILTIDAVVGLLTTVQQTRNGKPEGQAARDTLASITTEGLLQLSMLGDAALEQYRIVASLDRSDLDEAEIPRELEDFHEKLDRLFRQRQVLEIPGLTQLMVRKLKEPRSVLLTSGQAVNWGGPHAVTPAMLEHCLARMCAYCTLSRKTWEAEFPGFELMANFKVFSLANGSQTPPDCSSMLEVLAKAIGVHFPTLRMEYDDFRPLAAKLAKKEGLSNFAAWKRSLEVTTRQRASHPATALLPVLARYGCWSSSTSSVERGFSMAQQAKNPGCSQDQHVAREEDVLILNQDVIPKMADKEQSRLCEAAACVWRETCSRVRTSGVKKRAERWDKGISCRPEWDYLHEAHSLSTLCQSPVLRPKPGPQPKPRNHQLLIHWATLFAGRRRLERQAS